MPEEFPTDPVSLFLTIIISGGIVAGIFEGIRNWFIKRREEYIDITKLKIDKISTALPYYNKFIYYFNSFRNYVEDASKASDSMAKHKSYSKEYIYFISNILYLNDEFFKHFGALQLDCIDAEELLHAILNEFQTKIRRAITNRNLSIVRTELIRGQERTLLYHEFEDKLLYYQNIKQSFEDNFLNDEEKIMRLGNLCLHFVKILTFELNHTFSIWYGEEQNYKNLGNKTLQFIILDYPLYYERIKSFKKRKLSEPSTWIKGPKMERES